MGLADQIWGEEVMRRLEHAPADIKENWATALNAPVQLAPDPRYFAAGDPYVEDMRPPHPLDYVPQTFTVANTWASSWTDWPPSYEDTAVGWLRQQVEEMCAVGRSSL